MTFGVPLHELVVYITAAGFLLLGACYLPLLLKWPIPTWVQLSALAAALVLVAGVAFAMTFGHWPFRS